MQITRRQCHDAVIVWQQKRQPGVEIKAESWCAMLVAFIIDCIEYVDFLSYLKQNRDDFLDESTSAYAQRFHPDPISKTSRWSRWRGCRRFANAIFFCLWSITTLHRPALRANIKLVGSALSRECSFTLSIPLSLRSLRLIFFSFLLSLSNLSSPSLLANNDLIFLNCIIISFPRRSSNVTAFFFFF